LHLNNNKTLQIHVPQSQFSISVILHIHLKKNQTRNAGSKITAASGEMFPAYLVSIQALMFAE
jgi:hypothetical protein